MCDHLVRVGSLGMLARFRSLEGEVFQRGVSVVCRTSRGLEFGSILNVLRSESSNFPQTGQILRAATPEDHLLWSRMQRHRLQAMDACQLLLDQHASRSVLMDCEVLFDGQSILFYFLGDVSDEVSALTDELAATYEAKAELKQFADAMTLGCGPDCGTEAGGCSSGGCSTCQLASSCQPTR